MIQAIVFLPLIGCLAAGLFGRLIGARASGVLTSALLVLTVAAAEAAIGLAVLVVFFRNRGSIAVEDINLMKG